MIEVSYLQAFLFIAFIAVWILIKWQDEKTWQHFYAGTGTQIGKAQGVYGYLKNNGVRCKAKTVSPMGNTKGIHLTGAQMTFHVYVNKKDLSKAYRLLEQYTERY